MLVTIVGSEVVIASVQSARRNLRSCEIDCRCDVVRYCCVSDRWSNFAVKNCPLILSRFEGTVNLVDRHCVQNLRLSSMLVCP